MHELGKARSAWEWWSGENTCLPLLWFRFNSWTCCHIWVEFVVGSCSCSDPFSPYPWVLLPSQKLTFYVLPGNSGQGEPPCGSHLLNSHYYPINLRFVLFGWVISQNKSTCLSFRQHICKPCKEMIKVMSQKFLEAQPQSQGQMMKSMKTWMV